MNLVSTTQATELSFGLGESSLGPVLVGQSDAGVAAVLFGADAGDLEADLRVRFAGARIAPGEVALREVLAAVENPAGGFGGAVALHGTDFQRRVWTALTGIPAGETRSYGEIARMVGAPAAVRAVAAACAANAVAVLVPCHRVVRGDGSLAGYRWGVERKRALLERERCFSAAA